MKSNPTAKGIVATRDNDTEETPDKGFDGWIFKHERRVQFIANVAVAISVIVALIYSAKQIETDEATSRRDTSATIMSVYFSQPVFTAKTTLTNDLTQRWQYYEILAGQIAEARANSELATGEEAPLNETGEASPAPDDLKPEIRSAFVVLMEFYTSVARCERSGACDTEMTSTFFRQDICDFNKIYDRVAAAQIEVEYGRSISDELTAYCKEG